MKDRVEEYIVKNGLPKKYEHAYKISGLSLNDFINCNRITLSHTIIKEQSQKK